MSETPLLELQNIRKEYPGVVALDNVSMSFNKGEVHAVVGENGAGKSTLIKIITGAIKPTSGEIKYCGKKIDDMDPIKSLKNGICAIYQEFNLFPELSVVENIFYGREILNGKLIDKRRMNEESKKILSKLGVDINPNEQVINLSIAYQQIVEIAKVISRDVKLLIMDEPTATLSTNEIEKMFDIINKLREDGITVIYISHRLEEIFKISDRVTVMRDGKYITTLQTNDTDKDKLVSLMVGRELGMNFPEIDFDIGDKVLEANSVSTDRIHNVSFSLRKGEILGIAGLVGSGRTELARAIFGADPIKSGQIYVNKQKVDMKSPYHAIQNRIGLIPEDRKHQGVILNKSIRFNTTYSSLDKITINGFIQPKKESTIVNQYKTNLKIKTPSINQLVKNLSGGNQQKVALAKWLATDCDILIFDEPTRGIDIGAKQEIYDLIKELVNNQKSIIMISSEMSEIIGMCNRILVMNNGKIAGEISSQDATQEKILSLAIS